MKAPRRFTLFLTLTSIVLLGFVLWYFHSAPLPPQTAPVAQTPAVAPATKPQDVSLPAQSSQSAAGSSVSSSSAAPSSAQPARTSSASPAATLQTEPHNPVMPTQSAAVPSSQPAKENPAELAATARMYAAHEPLRTPEVADPDSKANQQILRTMVSKALAQPAATASTR